MFVVECASVLSFVCQNMVSVFFFGEAEERGLVLWDLFFVSFFLELVVWRVLGRRIFCGRGVFLFSVRVVCGRFFVEGGEERLFYIIVFWERVVVVDFLLLVFVLWQVCSWDCGSDSGSVCNSSFVLQFDEGFCRSCPFHAWRS